MENKKLGFLGFLLLVLLFGLWNYVQANGNEYKGKEGEKGPNLHLLDSTGQDLGILVNGILIDNASPAKQFTTYLPDEKVLVDFVQSRNPNEVIIIPSSQIYYSESDCKGFPYSNLPGNPMGIVIGQGNKVFKYVKEASFNDDHAFKSVLGSSGCSNETGQDGIYSLEQISLPFKLPLSWPLQIR